MTPGLALLTALSFIVTWLVVFSVLGGLVVISHRDPAQRSLRARLAREDADG